MVTQSGPVLALIDAAIERKRVCWKMARVFLEHEDAHGLQDIGVEIQSLESVVRELRKLVE